MIRPFKFFGDKIEFTETIPMPVEATITRAIITSSVVTFIECRNDMMYRQLDSQYVYGGYTSFTKDNIRYYRVSTIHDLLGRNFDNYILLHDAQEIEELEYIVANLEQRGATQMF